MITTWRVRNYTKYTPEQSTDIIQWAYRTETPISAAASLDAPTVDVLARRIPRVSLVFVEDDLIVIRNDG